MREKDQIPHLDMFDTVIICRKFSRRRGKISDTELGIPQNLITHPANKIYLLTSFNHSNLERNLKRWGKIEPRSKKSKKPKPTKRGNDPMHKINLLKFTRLNRE